MRMQKKMKKVAKEVIDFASFLTNYIKKVTKK